MITVESKAINEALKYLKKNDADFFERVWAQDLSKYVSRLKAIDFQNLDCVLDAGFGMGQWMIALANLNKHVLGIDYSQERVDAVDTILQGSAVKNVEIQQGSIENMSIADESVDAIFSYSVIFMTDYRKTLREFYRILKPNGKLYFTVNGLGWYLYCLIEEHNKSDMYDPRQMAISSLDSTINYFADERNKSVNASDQLIIPIDVLTKELIELGFDTPIVNYEGKINVTNEPANQSFYQKETYSNKPFIHEVLVTKV